MQVLAIANFRVSSDEQLLNNSLPRQERSVKRAAEQLGVEIVRIWSGSVSSKRGSNVDRKDLEQMIQECKKNKRIKYAIFDEVDRFMRSMLEIGYFIVEFKKLGVEIKFASQPNLKTDTAANTLMLMLEAFKAEGSNEERQGKSISGLTTALQNGYWPFQPKAGYKKGYVSGIPEIDPMRGLILRETILSILEYRETPTEALKKLNQSDFVKNRAKYKMDKFRAICVDPFYAGVVEMNKQVKYRNENGLHSPLITMDQHTNLVDIFAKKKKCQTGPRKNGNPDYPLSNIVHCEDCKTEKYGRYVGLKINNGVNKSRIYHKYRCRSCKKHFTRDELHKNVSAYVGEYQITEYGRTELIRALNTVWSDRRKNAEADKSRLVRDIAALRNGISNRVDAAILPDNASIKAEILQRIDEEKLRLLELEQKYEAYDKNDSVEKVRFITFALEHAENMERHFIELPKPRLLQCKQMLFPAGFRIDANKNVYTPEMSVLTRLASNKKDLPETEKSFMVRVRRL